MAFIRGCLLAVLAATTLYPQRVLERSQVELPDDERKAIEEARRGAKPRPFVARKTSLSDLEKAQIGAFDASKNSVVQIFLQSFDPHTGLPQTHSLGTGVIWDESGHIVTNYHIISGNLRRASQPLAPPSLYIRTSTGADHRAEIAGVLPESDLALIKVETPIASIKPIAIGRSSDLVVGRSVLAIGSSPSASDHSMTSGLISAIGRTIFSPVNTPIVGAIQTDAALSRGNTGGPLLNHVGQMIGLNVAIGSPSGWNAGLNFAIPSEAVISEIATLLDCPREANPLPPLAPIELARTNAFGKANHSVVGIHTKERHQDFWTGNVVFDPVGSGSGVVWDLMGHVVTNFHVVATADPMSGLLRAADIITVTLSDNREIRAHIVGIRPDIDIAVLKLDDVYDGLVPITIGSASDLTIGQSVLALGNPFGISQTLTCGIISAVNRTIDSPTGKSIHGVLQTDAAINPGNSGGPLLDLGGRLIGINTMIISNTGTNANVGFAVPVDLINLEIQGLTGNTREISTFSESYERQEEKNRAHVFNRAADSVVYVDAVTRKYDFHDEWTGNIFRLPPMSGTGIVWDDRGHVITAYSAVLMEDPLTGQISEAEKLTVTLADGKTYSARIVGRSLEYRIAVIRAFAPFKDLRPLPLARESDLKVGQSLFAIGNPFGMDYSLSAGILSAKKDQVSGSHHVFQTDVAINPGNIGGPLLDSEGRLAGMGLFMEGPGSHSGMNFALSSSTLNRIVPMLLAKGHVERPSLGFVSISDNARSFFRIEKGILVHRVEPDSPAARAGLKGLQPSITGRGLEIGDVIVGLRGKTVDNSETLWDLLEQESPGVPLPFDVQRDGKRIKVVIIPNGQSNSALK
ncbi:MAG: trypsin-like peptidase domain-containing protein [Holophagaceae bacterium]|nr:trypsin-like peptidase domain-containing protein [Holophagaceae bacterium]